jgi:hypothetical protein
MTPLEYKIWLEEQERGEYKTIGWSQVHGKALEHPAEDEEAADDL